MYKIIFHGSVNLKTKSTTTRSKFYKSKLNFFFLTIEKSAFSKMKQISKN